MDTKKIVITIGLFFILMQNIASAAAPVTQAREKLLFNNDWKFTHEDHPQNRDSVYNDATWRTLNLPHDWSIEGSL